MPKESNSTIRVPTASLTPFHSVFPNPINGTVTPAPPIFCKGSNKLKNPNANSNKKKIDDFKSINKGKVSKNKKNFMDEKIPAREKINAKQALNSKKKKRVKILCGITLFIVA